MYNNFEFIGILIFFLIGLVLLVIGIVYWFNDGFHNVKIEWKFLPFIGFVLICLASFLFIKEINSEDIKTTPIGNKVYPVFMDV